MRIQAIADMHGHLPDIPECDLLIIAGDVCPDYIAQGTRAEYQNDWLKIKFHDWYIRLPCDAVLATYGNHNFVGERFDNPYFTVDSLIEVDGLKVWLAPWITKLPFWAFNKTEEELVEIYDRIPEDIDILVTHAPPYGYGDSLAYNQGHVGSTSLLKAIERVRPKVVICGHIHPAYGKYNYDGIPIYNVACVDDEYNLVRGATEIDFNP